MDDKTPEGSMRPTSRRMLLGVALASGLVVYAVVDQAYTVLPIMPWTAIPTLALFAVAEGIAAVHTYRRIRRKPGTEPIEPLSAARLLALAKASAVFGALVVGMVGGMGLALHIPVPRADVLSTAGTVLAGALLVLAALSLEYACRVPGDERSEGSSPPQ